MIRNRLPKTATTVRSAKPRFLLVASMAAITIVLLAATASQAAGNNGQKELAQIRRATAKYHNVATAIADGYELGFNGMITACVSHPEFGAMGYHYFNAELMNDSGVDPLRPEGLVYAPAANGQLKLAAVEWVVPGGQPGVNYPPTVPGIDLELSVINPVLGWYIGHAWIWDPNPSGMFSNWNPDVICP